MDELSNGTTPEATLEPGAEPALEANGAPAPAASPEVPEASPATQEQIDEAVAQATSQLNQDIASLTASLNERTSELSTLKTNIEQGNTQIASLRQSRDEAVGKYKASLTAINPLIPQEMITGDTIEAIDTSLELARGLVQKIQDGLDVQRESETVPIGSPPRTGPITQDMSSRQKITYGLGQSQK